MSLGRRVIDIDGVSGSVGKKTDGLVSDTYNSLLSLPFSRVCRVNMYDKFDLNKCVILEEIYDDVDEDAETETATVKFIAEMVLKETGEMTSFMETSKFEKAKNSGAWLYLSGEIEDVPKDDEDDNDSDNEESTDDGKSIEERLASQL